MRPLMTALPLLLALACGGASGSSGGPGGAGSGSISAPALMNPGQTSLRADFTPSDATGLQWTLSAGTLRSGQGTATLFFDAPSSVPASGKLTLACTGTTAQGAVSASRDLPVVPPFGAPPAALLGPGVSGDALANTRVGGPYGTSVSCRFRAARTGTLAGFRKFLIWSATKGGYDGGTGGTLRFQLWSDDGTASHLPGALLAGATVDAVHPPTNGSGYYPLLTFTTPPALTAGTLYHLVITNVDGAPDVNYTSVDDVWTNAALAPAQPTLSDLDWSLLERSTAGANAWVLRQGYLPSLELHYGDGGLQGKGWMEVWSGNAKAVSGGAGVRERILIGAGDKVATGAYVRVKRAFGTGALELRLEDAAGALIDHVTVPAAQAQTAHYWVGGAFVGPRTLSSGQTYFLTLQAPADTRYEAFPLRDGAFTGYGDFQPESTFGPGCWAEFNPGSGWIGWDQWGASNRKDGDLQFYLTLQ